MEHEQLRAIVKGISVAVAHSIDTDKYGFIIIVAPRTSEKGVLATNIKPDKLESYFEKAIDYLKN